MIHVLEEMLFSRGIRNVDDQELKIVKSSERWEDLLIIVT